MVWELLLDHLGSIILSIVFIFTSIFGKPKTAEQIQKALEKKESKLTAKGEKLSQKLAQVAEEIVETNSKKGG